MITILDYGSGNLNAIKNIYERLNIPFEFAYPTSFVQDLKAKKISILPSDHTCRIAFEIDNTVPVKTDPKPVLEPSNEIKPDDFDIQLVV